jgi:hypothetical protein
MDDCKGIPGLPRTKDKILKTVRKISAKGKRNRVASEYKKLVKRDPHDLRIRLRLGYFYFKAGDKETAFYEYEFAAQHYTNEGYLIKTMLPTN